MPPETETIEAPVETPETAESILAKAETEDQDDPGEDQGHPTRTAPDGQIEISIPDTPLFAASENLVRARVSLKMAKEEFDKAEKSWLEEMDKVNKHQIKHKGDIIEAVEGRTIEDHARFKKS